MSLFSTNVVSEGALRTNTDYSIPVKQRQR